MNLNGWLNYLETLPSGLANRSLDRVKSVAEKLDLINFPRKVITVAGTNGKGSCVIFLEAILLAAGLRVGAFISPHVLHYNERIRLGGIDVADEVLCEAFALVERARAAIVLSYFEFSTLAALVIFKKQQPDIVICEVGLGGRFDAVNILHSDIAIITTISLDHTQVLGNSLETIGYEKAGIMRPCKPIICGDNMPESIFIAAKSTQAKLYGLNIDFFYTEDNNYWEWHFGQTTLKNLPLLRLPMPSAALALMAVTLLAEEFNISDQAINSGLRKAFLIGRWQQVKFAGKEIIFDVAHNPESAALLAANLTKNRSGGRILAVVSMLRDKDIAATLKSLVTVADRWYIGVLENKRAATALQLSQTLQSFGVTNILSLPTVTASLQQAIAECQEKDRIVVFGSFRTVAEGLRACSSMLSGKGP